MTPSSGRSTQINKFNNLTTQHTTMGKNSGGSRTGGGGGGATKEAGLSSLPAAQARSLAKIESGIRDNNYESAAIVDEKGKVLLNKKGEAHQVAFTKDEMSKMKGNMLTHNHPGDGGFSRQDFDLVASGDLKGIRAVGKTNTFTLTKPDSWSGHWTQVDHAYRLANIAVRKQYNKNPTAEFSKNYYAKVSAKAAAKLGWKFTQTTK